MALTGTDRGTGGNNAAATSLTVAPTSNMTAGALGVLKVALDNAGAAGASAVAPTSVTDSAGNTWTRRQSGIYDPGAASAGVEEAIYTATLTTALTTAGSIVLNWLSATSVTAKAWALEEFTAAAGKFAAYVTGGVNVGAGTAAPTVTTSSIPTGDAVSAMGGAESADTWAGDADVSSGSWSAHQHNGFGTTTNGMSITSQRKIVSGAATQTYNPTLTSADCILAWIQITELNAYTLAAAQAGFTLTGNAANLLSGRKLVAAQAAFTLTRNDAGLLWKHVLAAVLGSYTMTGFAALFTKGRAMAAALGSYALTGNAAGLTQAKRLTAAQASFTLTGNATSLLHGYVIQAAMGAYTLTGFNATLTYGANNSRTLTAAAATFTLTGNTASFPRGYVIQGVQASFAFTGKAASLLYGRKLAAATASFAITGNAAALKAARLLAAVMRTYALTGNAVQLIRTRILRAILGTYTFTGYAVSMVAPLKVKGAQYTFTPPAHSSTFASDGGLIFTAPGAARFNSPDNQMEFP